MRPNVRLADRCPGRGTAAWRDGSDGARYFAGSVTRRTAATTIASATRPSAHPAQRPTADRGRPPVPISPVSGPPGMR